MADKYALLAAIWIVIAIVLVAPRPRWPYPEEWAAILWPVVVGALLLVILIGLPLLAYERVVQKWRGRHG